MLLEGWRRLRLDRTRSPARSQLMGGTRADDVIGNEPHYPTCTSVTDLARLGDGLKVGRTPKDSD